jgi:hypothetical protein
MDKPELSLNNIVLGIDASTSIVGWAFSNDKLIIDAGFLNISKIETNKEKGKFVIDFLSKHPHINRVNHINLEAALSGFGGGRTSQQTLITLSRWNAILEYMMSENFKFPIVLCNVNTMRKKVFGKARINGIKPKEYVKSQIPLIVSNITQFEKLNRYGDWDSHNSDTYDAIVCALYG